MTIKLTREEALQHFKEQLDIFGGEHAEAIKVAIEALEREDHDGCDGCMYEHYEELTEPCYSCKHNYTDRYMPEPKHDRDWIVGCIKHDGFIKTDRGDKANQIILEALKDRPRGEWIPVSEKPKDEERTYLVQLDGGGMCSCRWTNVNPFWTDLTTEWHWCIFDIPQYCKVVAWMDLEPYKGGENE